MSGVSSSWDKRGRRAHKSTHPRMFEVGEKSIRALGLFTSTWVVSLLLYVSIGCSGTPSTNQVRSSELDAPLRCKVTLPNGSQPPVPHFGGTVEYSSPSRGSHDKRVEGSHGNGRLWVVLPPDGKLLVTPERDGSLGGKFPWWRGVRGHLTIWGRRLDAPGSPTRVSVPEGYGETGFQSSGVYFPSEGCWEITGSAGDAELTFVVDVRIQR